MAVVSAVATVRPAADAVSLRTVEATRRLARLRDLTDPQARLAEAEAWLADFPDHPSRPRVLAVRREARVASG